MGIDISLLMGTFWLKLFYHFYLILPSLKTSQPLSYTDSEFDNYGTFPQNTALKKTKFIFRDQPFPLQKEMYVIETNYYWTEFVT